MADSELAVCVAAVMCVTCVRYPAIITKDSKQTVSNCCTLQAKLGEDEIKLCLTACFTKCCTISQPCYEVAVENV